MKNYKLKKEIDMYVYISCKKESEGKELLRLFKYLGYTWEDGEIIEPESGNYISDFEFCYVVSKTGISFALKEIAQKYKVEIISFKEFWEEYVEEVFEASTEAKTPQEITTLYKDLLKGYKKAQEGYELAVEREDSHSILYYNGRIDVYRSVLFTLEFELGDISIYKNEKK